MEVMKTLYIVLFLHQTTTLSHLLRSWLMLYIVLFLHQTTTNRLICLFCRCCISYYSYIKPQPDHQTTSEGCVVYRTIPTSNHNSSCLGNLRTRLYIVLFLHQTTTLLSSTDSGSKLYIVLFLHQTTTRWRI